MKNTVILLCLSVLFLASCSTGKKALQKGDYYSAIMKAVDRLKSSPDNKNATNVIRDGYPMMLDWTQEEMDQVLSTNSTDKWERAIGLMEQVNRLSSAIRSTPATRNIINNPKTYTSELTMAYEKAAEMRYNAGLEELKLNTKESARRAFDDFYATNRYVEGYKDVQELMQEAKEMATVNVILQTIPTPSIKYKLSSEFFYDQVFKYLNNQYGPNSFVQVYSPYQADKEGLDRPDFIVDMEFFDFSVGNLTHSEKEENLENKVKIETRDTTQVHYKTYKAKLKTFTDQVVSGGRLRVRVYEPSTDRLLVDDLVPGSFTWVNDYAMYVGDKEALNKQQLELTKRKVLPLPPEQDLFVEFTKPIYSQVTGKLNRFFSRYN
ncbi:MAG TPA: hypothetical protein PK335_08170 [Draconibacterium sp.]|nr:hypothetical protein [Draconibacterium sp.]